MTQYVIEKLDDGKEVYKRRIVVHKRVEKERPPDYHENKERALSARFANQPGHERETSRMNMLRYTNIFSQFA